ncbi:hypothetical protein [Streptomyces sp. ATCC 21386]|uniref:hypothetical protein n=1 Tax=Streptomyces sp. ATCC 21386 TaxID=2699428 RepID=UPI002044DB29|nr:hypothetical protein [Streptomyces sp. ATCC 21386]
MSAATRSTTSPSATACTAAPARAWPARLEAHAVLGALVWRVSSIELAGEPVRKLNNVIWGMASLPVTVRTERQ